MLFVLLLFLIISIFLEGTLTSLPLVFLCLLCMTIILRDLRLFVAAFFSGIFLDAFALRPIGETSIFFLIVVLLVLLYQRKYEINTYPFMFIASFVGSLIYLLAFDYHGAFIEACASAVIAVLLLALIRYVDKQFAIAHF